MTSEVFFVVDSSNINFIGIPERPLTVLDTWSYFNEVGSVASFLQTPESQTFKSLTVWQLGEARNHPCETLLHSPSWPCTSNAANTLFPTLHWLRVPERVTFRLCVLAYRCLSWNSAGVPCWEPAPDIWRRHSTSSALCWLSHAGRTVHQTFNTRWPCLPSGFGTCVEQPAVVCQECTVADDVPSRAEDCVFSVVVWQWLGDRDCTAQYNCCLPATTDCRRFCRFVCFSFLFNFVRCPCNVFDVI